jgi:hypothetical protein
MLAESKNNETIEGQLLLGSGTQQQVNLQK